VPIEHGQRVRLPESKAEERRRQRDTKRETEKISIQSVKYFNKNKGENKPWWEPDRRKTLSDSILVGAFETLLLSRSPEEKKTKKKRRKTAAKKRRKRRTITKAFSKRRAREIK
jgi:hypothetical protein